MLRPALTSRCHTRTQLYVRQRRPAWIGLLRWSRICSSTSLHFEHSLEGWSPFTSQNFTLRTPPPCPLPIPPLFASSRRIVFTGLEIDPWPQKRRCHTRQPRPSRHPLELVMYNSAMEIWAVTFDSNSVAACVSDDYDSTGRRRVLHSGEAPAQ